MGVAEREAAVGGWRAYGTREAREGREASDSPSSRRSWRPRAGRP